MGVGVLGLTTLSPFCIYYAQEARTYALTLTLALGASWALLAWLNKPRWGLLTLHSLSTMLCLYTHYAALFLPLAHIAFVFSSVRKAGRRRTLYTLGAETMAIMLFLPWPLHVWRQLPELMSPAAITPPPAPIRRVAHVLWATLVEFSAGRTVEGPMAFGATLLFLFLLILGATSPHTPPQTRRFLHLSLGLPLVGLLLLPRTGVYFSPKYLIVTLPAFYCQIVAGLQVLYREMRCLFWGCVWLVMLVLAWGLGDWFFRMHIKVA